MHTISKQVILFILFLLYIVSPGEIQGTRLRFVRKENEEAEAKNEILKALEGYGIDIELARTLNWYNAILGCCIATALKNFTCTPTIEQPTCIYDAPIHDIDVIDVIEEKIKDMVVLVGANHVFKRIIVAFRGTKTFKNAINDIKLQKMSYPLLTNFKLKKLPSTKSLNNERTQKRGYLWSSSSKMSGNFSMATIDEEWAEVTLNGSMVHSGFYSVWASVAPHVIHALEKAMRKYPHYPVVFTGHSLGGAIASLGATALHLDGNYTVDAIYTFGEPKFGNTIFSEFFQYFVTPRRFRFVNHRDIIPHLPPWGLGFQHAGIELLLDNSGEVTRICDKYCIDASTQDGLALFRYTIHEHFNYLNVNRKGMKCGIGETQSDLVYI
jgi:hypothetical protein